MIFRVGFRAPPGKISVSRSAIAFEASVGAGRLAAQVAALTTNGEPTSVALTTTTATGGPWLNASIDKTITPATLQVLADTSQLPAGSYSGIVAINASNAEPKTLTVPVTLQVRPAVPPEISVDARLEKIRASPHAAKSAATMPKVQGNYIRGEGVLEERAIEHQNKLDVRDFSELEPALLPDDASIEEPSKPGNGGIWARLARHLK